MNRRFRLGNRRFHIVLEIIDKTPCKFPSSALKYELTGGWDIMPKTLSDLWNDSKDIFETKSLAQLLTFSGEGKLKDGNSTCLEFRALLKLLPTKLLEKYIEECLTAPFHSSPYALQDIVNEIGNRIGFEVIPGLYKGKKNANGYDGLWKSADNDMIVEVKTTDAYAINLDTIANYRSRLIESGLTEKENSSILMVVGRKDTGGLEAQIRGSKHAWDIRLISIDSLIKLLRLKEELLDDENTFRHICQILKPLEFTRLDYLIDTIFITGRDAQYIDENTQIILQSADMNVRSKGEPVHFNDACIAKIQEKLHIQLNKQTRTLYDNKEENIGLTCAVSKNHGNEALGKYWFAFHPHQQEALRKYQRAYVCFGCGNSDFIFLFALDAFISYLDKIRTTDNGGRKYWHIEIEIKENGGRCLLLRRNRQHIDISAFRL